MMKRLYILLALFPVLAVSAARAGELAGSSAPRIVEISESDCRRIAPYLPGGADYVPGVAADGGAVAPADVDGGYRYGLRPHYEFDVTIDPLVGQNPAFTWENNLPVAHVAIGVKTGRITIDGQDVTGTDHALAEACARLHHVAPK